MTFDINALAGLVDTDHLEYTEDSRESLNRARLIQGNPEFEKDPQLNKTVRYLGGIGLNMDGLAPEIAAQGTPVTLQSPNSNTATDWAVFTELDVVILTTARIRRFYAEIDGQERKLACGSNQAGRNAVGWSGQACVNCAYNKNNYDGDKKEACQSSVAALVYFPQLDHTAIFTGKGAHYIQTTEWFDQVSNLSHKFAQRAEIQAASPGLKRVNSYFFKTTIKASEFQAGTDGMFNTLAFSKADQPYQWDQVVNSPEVINRCKQILEDMKEAWNTMYIQPSQNAAFVALPGGGQPPIALPSSQPSGAQVEKTTVAAPAEVVEEVPAAVQSTAQPAAAAPAASSIMLPEMEAAANPPVNVSRF